MKTQQTIAMLTLALLFGPFALGAQNRQVTHNESGIYEAFPDVCRLADGELVAVFYAGYGHVSLPKADAPKGGRICLMRSKDNGRTWSEPVALVDLDGDDRDPSIMQTKQGTLICSFMTYHGRAEVPVSFVVRVMQSFDQGKTCGKHLSLSLLPSRRSPPPAAPSLSWPMVHSFCRFTGGTHRHGTPRTSPACVTAPQYSDRPTVEGRGAIQ